MIKKKEIFKNLTNLIIYKINRQTNNSKNILRNIKISNNNKIILPIISRNNKNWSFKIIFIIRIIMIKTHLILIKVKLI
jgi:hypothetical protein